MWHRRRPGAEVLAPHGVAGAERWLRRRCYRALCSWCICCIRWMTRWWIIRYVEPWFKALEWQWWQWLIQNLSLHSFLGDDFFGRLLPQHSQCKITSKVSQERCEAWWVLPPPDSTAEHHEVGVTVRPKAPMRRLKTFYIFNIYFIIIFLIFNI